MNICMFTNTYLPHVGGVARSVSVLEKDLRNLGHQVLVVAPEYSEKEAASENADEKKDRETEPEAEGVLRLPAIQNFNGSDFSLRIPMPFFVSEKVDAFAPDLIHSHHPYLLGDTALRTAQRIGLPVVFTHHTRYEQYVHHVTEDLETLRKFAQNLATEYANLCSCVIAPSRSIAELIRSRGVDRPIHVIPTGVDLDFFSAGRGKQFRRRKDIPADAPVVGHVGRLAPEKNLSYLAEAAARFLEKNADSRFLVVGEGPSEKNIRDAFEDGLEDRLVMAGRLSGQELSDAYAAMDLFAFSSQSETQGMVVAEAMAAAKPVVALDAPGVREMIEDGKNGRLLPADASAESFSEALAQLLEDSGLLETMSGQARQTAESVSRENCARKVVSLYESVRKQERRRRKDFSGLDDLFHRLQSEWELVSGKFAALKKAVDEDVFER
ncbi:MAG: glycosyltransferase [Desulfobacterales bacterium]|nr:glycosyltransferase [Desulfobacterales bacterium]